jgi:hypothetical protein
MSALLLLVDADAALFKARLQDSTQVGCNTRGGIANSIYHRSLPCGQKMQSLRVLRPLWLQDWPSRSASECPFGPKHPLDHCI